LLIDALLAKQLGAMKALGDEFVSGYIKLAEGEKDPRNLMLAFGIGRVVLIEFDPYKHLDVSIDPEPEAVSLAKENALIYRTCSISYTATSPSLSARHPTIRTTSHLWIFKRL
jgi:hypothetical protein